jgi:hypothetical protein
MYYRLSPWSIYGTGLYNFRQTPIMLISGYSGCHVHGGYAFSLVIIGIVGTVIDEAIWNLCRFLF